jgi:adenosine deaminase
MKRTAITKLPKVELHTHIDCSLSYAAVRELRADTSLEEYRQKFKAPARCENLAEFLACIDPSLEIMQTKAALTLAAADIADQLAADNVVYAEVRFAPLLHCREGLAPEDVVEAVLKGLESAGTSIGLLLCTLRHFSTGQGMTTLDLVQRYSNAGVVGLDLAADEKNFPIAPHVPVFRKAREAGISRTAHAGEARGAESVIETITQLSPTRIGHGVRSIEDRRATDMVIEAGIHLEVCPSVNVQIGVFPSFKEHPLEKLRQLGVSVGVNTDARTVTGVSLNEEYEIVSNVFGWNEDHFRRSNLAAIDASFAPSKTKAAIRSLLDSSA